MNAQQYAERRDFFLYGVSGRALFVAGAQEVLKKSVRVVRVSAGVGTAKKTRKAIGTPGVAR